MLFWVDNLFPLLVVAKPTRIKFTLTYRIRALLLTTSAVVFATESAFNYFKFVGVLGAVEFITYGLVLVIFHLI